MVFKQEAGPPGLREEGLGAGPLGQRDELASRGWGQPEWASGGPLTRHVSPLQRHQLRAGHPVQRLPRRPCAPSGEGNPPTWPWKCRPQAP